MNNIIDKTSKLYNGLYPEKELVTVSVLGFNNLEKTRNCLDALIKNTSHIDYRLVLVDSGSTEADILGLFKSINHPKKTIIAISKNLGSNYAYSFLLKTFNTRFLAILPNDVVCTPRWLDNLLKCIQSDDKIGWATACTSNVSNRQLIDIKFNNLEELQEKANAFNVSDPRKWEERLRLINLAPIIRKEVVDRVGGFDFGYFHDFCEDDYCRRIRNLGYKIYVIKDTFLHHDHSYTNVTQEVAKRHSLSLRAGRENYYNKFNIDAWNSVLNFEIFFIHLLEKLISTDNKIREDLNKNLNNIKPNILGVNIGSGTPLLEIKNILKLNNIFDANTYAFTTDANAFNDLVLVTENINNVNCGKLKDFNKYYEDIRFTEFFDFIVVSTPVNRIEKPFEFIRNLLKIAKKGCKILIKFENVYNADVLLKTMGYNLSDNNSQEISDTSIINTSVSSMRIEDFIDVLDKIKAYKIVNVNEPVDDAKTKQDILKEHISDDNTMQKLLCKNTHFCIVV